MLSSRAWFPAVVTLLGLGCPNLACSGDGRPPRAGDAPDEGQDSGLSLADDVIQGVPDLTPCGAFAQLEIQRPNFYFVLDSSESMVESMPGTGGDSRHQAARRAILDMLRAVGYRVNYGAAVFPSADIGGGCSAGREIFPIQPGETLPSDGGDGPLLNALSFTLRRHSPAGATPIAATLKAIAEPLLALEEPTVVFLVTDGGPNCGDSLCGPDSCIPNIEGAGFENGPVCDENLNCCAPDLFPHLCLDDASTQVEIERLAAGGIATYVIGIPGSDVYANVLAEFARAGGTARDVAPGYYSVADAAELGVTLSALGHELSASCELELSKVPKRPETVRVFADTQEVELDDEDGWEWDDEQTLRLLGSACQRWRSAEVTRIEAFEGCDIEIR